MNDSAPAARVDRADPLSPSTAPAYAGNFPDPFVMALPPERRTSDIAAYYAFATNGPLGNVQILASADLASWTEIGDAMPDLAAWVEPGRTWAPEVLPLPDGRYAMYYTARSRTSNRQAIGVALADHPAGPYVDEDDGPLLDEHTESGSIDASPLRDTDGTTYLLWKNDGNAIGIDTWIKAMRIDDADPGRLVGDCHLLIKQDQPWEGALVEGPFVWLRNGRYYLFYAANTFDQPAYAEGYAEAETVLGPYTKAAENPILGSGDYFSGPGHASVFRAVEDGVGPSGGAAPAGEHGTWIAYHAWPAGGVDEEIGRQFWLDELRWVDGRPVVRRPAP